MSCQRTRAQYKPPRLRTLLALLLHSLTPKHPQPLLLQKLHSPDSYYPTPASTSYIFSPLSQIYPPSPYRQHEVLHHHCCRRQRRRCPEPWLVRCMLLPHTPRFPTSNANLMGSNCALTTWLALPTPSSAAVPVTLAASAPSPTGPTASATALPRLAELRRLVRLFPGLPTSVSVSRPHLSMPPPR